MENLKNKEVQPAGRKSIKTRTKYILVGSDFSQQE